MSISIQPVVSLGALAAAVPSVVKKAGVTVASAATTNLFTITGYVWLIGLYGYCPGAIGAAATSLKVTAAPTSGTPTDLANNVGIQSSIAGTIFGPSGTTVTTLGATGAGAFSGQASPSWLLAPGSLQQIVSGTGTSGTIDWYLYWLPVSSGATAVSA